MKEKFAKPCVAAIIEKKINNEKYILIQTRRKEDDYGTNGLFEITAGKIREYENIFDTIKREVMEETGLTITKINGKVDPINVNGNEVLLFEPFCVTQNLSGIYSIILNTFLCEAEGELLLETDETVDIHWEKASVVKDIVFNYPEKFFLMHILGLKKYFDKE